MWGTDPSVIEALSWRLASELFRRHTQRLRLIRAHPGGGQYDVLMLFGVDAPGRILLNRAGTIQIHERFDHNPAIEWEPVEWDRYARADPYQFLIALERAAGLSSPVNAPATTPTSLTYRVLAAASAASIKTVAPITIEQGFIDSSGYGSGPNATLEQFDSIPGALLQRQDSDLFGHPGYRFWIITRSGEPLAAVEQSTATAWAATGETVLDLMETYRRNGRNVLAVAVNLLSWPAQQ